eukprot:5591832-Karenia_brevis.AAC.1
MNGNTFLVGMKSIPPEDNQLGVTQQGKPREDDVLVHMVRSHLEARRRLRNRENMEHGGHGHGFGRKGWRKRERK